MKLKLDENLGMRGRDLLMQAGHDVCTVPAQDLCRATDEEVAARCRSDARGIVTLDLDFANPFRFPPSEHHGIAVLRGPARMSEEALQRLLATLVRALGTQPFVGALWIVEEGRVRVFEPPV
jgi:predicted nuclease of predicted toxin-antitoxin system